ncbi:MAG: hypothetical protein AAF192_10645 [Pseudomonadota bacterium]
MTFDFPKLALLDPVGPLDPADLAAEFGLDFDPDATLSFDPDAIVDLSDSFVFEAPTASTGPSALGFAAAGAGFASAGFSGSASGSGVSSISGSASSYVAPDGSSFASVSGSASSGSQTVSVVETASFPSVEAPAPAPLIDADAFTDFGFAPADPAQAAPFLPLDLGAFLPVDAIDLGPFVELSFDWGV